MDSIVRQRNGFVATVVSLLTAIASGWLSSVLLSTSDLESNSLVFYLPGIYFGFAIVVSLLMFRQMTLRKLWIVLLSGIAYYVAIRAFFLNIETGSPYFGAAFASFAGALLLLISFHFLCRKLLPYQFVVALVAMTPLGMLFVSYNDGILTPFFIWQPAMMLLVVWFLAQPQEEVKPQV